MIDHARQNPEQWDLVDVVLEAQQGNRDAFDVLCERYVDMVFRIVNGMLDDVGLAQEITQDVFMKVFNTLQTCREPVKFKSWLLKIAINESRNAWRGNKKAQERAVLSYDSSNSYRYNYSGTALLPPDIVILREQQQEILQTISNLRSNLRAVILLSYYQGMSDKEVAETLERPIGTIKRWLHEARSQLRAKLGDKI